MGIQKLKTTVFLTFPPTIPAQHRFAKFPKFVTLAGQSRCPATAAKGS
jgi:hypothetical protein